jgi:DNA-binding XRE family transcriptional regulator
MDLRDRFATNLRRLRHQRGFSQEELADAAGVNRTYMSKIETGATYVPKTQTAIVPFSRTPSTEASRGGTLRQTHT